MYVLISLLYYFFTVTYLIQTAYLFAWLLLLRIDEVLTLAREDINWVPYTSKNFNFSKLLN